MLKEAHRVLEPSPRSRLVVVEPFRRWWRPKDHEAPAPISSAVGQEDLVIEDRLKVEKVGCEAEG